MIPIEWYKAFHRPQTYARLGIVVGFVVVLTVALAATGSGQTEFVGDLPLLMVPRTSGFSVPIIALSSTMKFFLPLTVSVFAGEAVAGEAGWGSLRYLLARPISRTRILWSKAAVAGALSAIALLLLAVAALIAGGLAFGWHSLKVTDGSTSTPTHPQVDVVPLGTVFGHLGITVLYVGAGMASIFAVAFFLSTTTRRPLVAVAGGVAVTILSRVFNADYLPGIAVVNRYMPNNDIDLWQHQFTRPADLSGVPHFLVLQAVYFVVFMALAQWWFTRKDILD
ncbi:MAG TPA: ABC transporter permease [Acidimicrobiales bacterium]|nr:ABC transporter permease [Acidimicrobiales bacterium]